MCLMKDIFNFESPLGILGSIADKIILTNYFNELIAERNNIIKEFAESEKWRQVLTVS